MKKALRFTLCMVLVLGMLPASLLSALAGGYGVGRDETENQSINNAPGQYIPEGITVDGVFDDTGWDKDGWNYVSSATGTWNSKYPAEANADLKYTYQLRADYDYFYAAAVIDLPEGVTDGTFTVYLSDVHPYDDATKNQRGVTAGFIFTIKDGVLTDTPIASTGADDAYEKGSSEKGPYGDGLAYLKDCLFEKGVDADGNLYFEFRNAADATYNTQTVKYTDIYYYVSVDLPTEFNGEAVTESLFHPIFTLITSGWYNEVDYEVWPEGGGVVKFLHDGSDPTTLPGVVTVDGKLDESLWAGLTGFYEGEDKNIVEYKNTISAGVVGTNLVSLNTVKYNDKDGKSADHVSVGGQSVTIPADEIQHFKSDVRTDGKYLYGAVYLYAKNANKTHMILRLFNENNARTHEIRFNYNGPGNSNVSAVSTGAKYVNGAWEEDQIPYTQLYGYDPLEWGITRPSENIYVFEFRLPLSVADDDSRNIKFVKDDNATGKYRITGTDNDIKNGDGIYYAITTGRTASRTNTKGVTADVTDYISIGIKEDKHQQDGSVSIRKFIDVENQVGSASETVVIDGKLDDDVWTVLRGADNQFDGSYRQGSNESPDRTVVEKTVYKLSADREYLYGAVIVKLCDGKTWSVNEKLRLWINANGDSSGTRYVISFVSNGTNGVSEYSCHSDKSGDSIFKLDTTVSIDAHTATLKGGNVFLLEFKLSLRDFNIKTAVTADDSDMLLSYYLTAGTGNGDKKTLVHPMQDTYGGTFDATKNGDLYYKYANKITYGDLLESVNIDGIFTEELWDESKLVSADFSNSSLTAQPSKNDSFSFSYNVYTGSSYLYGAVVLDRVATENAEFSIWLDNYIDERDWIGDSAKHMVEYEIYQNVASYHVYVDELSDPTKSTGKYATDEKGNPLYEQITTNRIRYFVNHKYTFKYSGTSEANPSWYNTDRTNNSNTSVAIEDGVNYSYAINVVNGKTYLEFMIDLDNFHCDVETGFRYYISVTESIGNVDSSEPTQVLTATHPKCGDNTAFWLTAVNSSPTSESAGIIYNNANSVATYNSQTMTYWLHLAFEPTGNAGEYKIVERIYLNGEAGEKTHCTLPTGGFIYTMNSGTAYVPYSYKLKSETDNDLSPTTGLNLHFVDTRNPRAYTARDAALSWAEGDVFTFNFDPMDAGDITSNNKHTVISITTDGEGPKNTVGEVTSETTKYIDPNNVNDSHVCGNAIANVGYYSTFTATRVNLGTAEQNDDERLRYMPTLDDCFMLDSANAEFCFMYGTASILNKLAHFAPDEVTVNGDLGDTGWDKNGWIYADAINSAIIGDEVKFRYQLRTDDTYLYVAAVIESAYAEGTAFRIWLNGNGGDHYTNYYELSYGNKSVIMALGTPTNPEWADTLDHQADYGLTMTDDVLTYNSNLVAAENKNDAIDFMNVAEKSYGESALFGYTKELEENTSDGIWEWNAHPRTYGFRYGIECGVITSADGVRINSESGTADQTVVEFKVELADFGGADGFEYFVQAYTADGEALYPYVVSEISSEKNYYRYNYPEWAWDSEHAVSVTSDDVSIGGKLWLRNEYAPIVTLGAKISDSYIAPDDGLPCKAIRLGALYKESYIRKTNVVDGTTYWDVADMGIVILPSLALGENELTLETEGVVWYAADNIVNWVHNTSDNKTNFADYENFAFYVTLWGIEGAEDMEFAFRGFIDYYEANGSETYYSTTLYRNYNMVRQTVNESSEGVLPE